MEEHQLVELTAIFVLGVAGQWLAWWLRLPSILALLLIGLTAGPLTGWLDPDHLLGDLLFPLVSLSVGVILFEGGLTLRFSDLRGISAVVQRLLSVGALTTLAGSTVAAYFILDLSLEVALLLGAVLVVTGPTVVGPLLKHVRPTGRVGPTLRWEGILIDPVGAILGVLIFDAILSRELANSFSPFLTDLLITAVVGFGIGVLAAALLTLALYRYLIPDHLHNPVALLMLVGAFALSNTFAEEAGLLAVTVMGVVVGNQRYVAVRHITELQENLGAMLIGILFILLAARLPLEQLEDVLNLRTLAFLLVLILIVRPLTVAVSTVRSELDLNERVFLAWLAPRGIVAAAVSSLFAIRLSEAGIEEASVLAPLTFAVIIGTVSVYSLTAAPLARLLKLSQENPQGVLILGANPLTTSVAAALKERGFEVLLVDANRDQLRQARMQGLTTHHGNILSEEMEESLDLGGIGRFLAMSSNSELNSLAVLSFAHVFGRANCYQIDAGEDGPGSGETAIHLQGRRLFDNGTDLRRLEAMLAAGAVVKATPLSEQFDYDAYMAYYGDQAAPLFIEDANGALQVLSSDWTPSPRPGQTVIALVVETAAGS